MGMGERAARREEAAGEENCRVRGSRAAPLAAGLCWGITQHHETFLLVGKYCSSALCSIWNDTAGTQAEPGMAPGARAHQSPLQPNSLTARRFQPTSPTPLIPGELALAWREDRAPGTSEQTFCLHTWCKQDSSVCFLNKPIVPFPSVTDLCVS